MNPRSSSESTAFETVGAVSPDTRASAARDNGPLCWITSKRRRSLIRRSNFDSIRFALVTGMGVCADGETRSGGDESPAETMYTL
jgi:hypothetical protein